MNLTNPSQYQENPDRRSVVSFLSSKISKKSTVSNSKALDMIVVGGDNLLHCNDILIRSNF